MSVSARRNSIRLGLACVIVVLAMHTRAYASVWRSDLALWQWAARQAPAKPRPWVNYGVALASHGHVAAARAAWNRAVQTTTQPHVPWWDRDASGGIAQENLSVLNKAGL